MRLLASQRRMLHMALVPESPLRAFDPRAKLALCLAASLAVTLPFDRLAVAIGLYFLVLFWARLLMPALRQLWRMRLTLLVLFIVDWLLISLDHAVAVTLRLTLLTGTFMLLFATTTPAEFRLAMEWLRVPERYAFSISLAFQSMGLLDQEWRAIHEAQQARGAWSLRSGARQLRERFMDLLALTVPAIVMTARHAWAITEAAYARGFGSPHRQPYRRLVFLPADWALLVAAVAAALLMIFLR